METTIEGRSPVEIIAQLLSADVDPVQAGVRLQQLANHDGIGGIELFELLASAKLGHADPAILGGLLRLVHVKLLRSDGAIERLVPATLAALAERLGDAVPNRHLLLHLLAKAHTPESLTVLVDSLLRTPPQGWMAAGQVLSPLMQSDDWPIESVFPRLLDGLSELSLAAPILDIAAHLVRSGRTAEHVASDRAEMLEGLLGEVVGRLGRLEEAPRSFGSDVDTVQTILSEAVALAVSLCDAIGLMGLESASGKLRQALELRHRRVQCEAAGSLARLGIVEGRECLIALAREPAARLRAIAYADELGFGDQIDEELRSDIRTAEAELALWLAQPQNMGVPPSMVEVVDSRRMLWPSYHDPVDVFLVRFEYDFGDRVYSNVGMTGPGTHVFSADVADLPVDDIYAMYAGWHAEHPDIVSLPREDCNESQLRVFAALADHLERSDYGDVTPERLCFFLDETAAVFSASHHGVEVLAITDGLETMELATGGRPRPPAPENLFHLYAGRKMLRTFNS
ncbi:MAG: HEAT repeat domain-containing protein [Planctomycetota bacterium]